MPRGVYIRTEDHKKNLSIAMRGNPNVSRARLKFMKENPEKSYEYSAKGGKVANGKGLKSAWENNRELMIDNCRKTAKITNGKGIKNLWKNSRELMLKFCSKGGKAGKGKTGNVGKSIGGQTSIKKQNKLNPSPIELLVRNYLDEFKINHKNNFWFEFNGKRKEADIVVPKHKLIIECDGWAHQKFDSVKSNDRIKTKIFKKLGYKVLRLTGMEIRNRKFKTKLYRELTKVGFK